MSVIIPWGYIKKTLSYLPPPPSRINEIKSGMAVVQHIIPALRG